MGANQSHTTLTRDKVFELTQSTRNIMDILLEYMLKEITVRDFLALSNPTECKKYVIFLANNLHKHFYELQIVPTKDRKGVIAFRPVKDLTSDVENTSETQEKQSLCLTLAYFYTRIFQIYGALALTLIDDSKFMMESGIIPIYGDTSKKGLIAPGYGKYISTGGAPPPATSLGNFNFLRTFLADEYLKTKEGFLTVYSGEGDNRGEIRFLPKIQDFDEFDRPSSQFGLRESVIQKAIFNIGLIGGKTWAKLEAYAKVEGIGSTIKFAFGKFTYYIKTSKDKRDTFEQKTIDLPSDVLSIKTITIDKVRPIGSKIYTYSIKGSNKSISDFFTNILSNVVLFLKKNTYITSDTSPQRTEMGTVEELRLARIIQNLTKTKPLGHCLARALQLLQNTPLKGEQAVSYICKAKFFEQSVSSTSNSKISRSGIPEAGASLDTSPGLASLSQLFYDTVLIGTPKIVIGSMPRDNKMSSLELYMEFMKKIGRLFGDDVFNTKMPSQDLIKSGLKSIKNKRDQQICKGMPDNITIPAPIVGNVYDVVNQLYKIQISHASECGKIIKSLFDIVQDKTTGKHKISLSENIINKGFPEIDRINYEARNVLVNYYSNCEMTYLKGMKIILDSSPEAKAIHTSNSANQVVIQ